MRKGVKVQRSKIKIKFKKYLEFKKKNYIIYLNKNKKTFF